MQPCVSQACTMPATFAVDVQALGEAGGGLAEAWLTKLEKHLEGHSADQTRELLSSRGVRLAAASYQGGLLLSEGEARAAHLAHFKSRLGLCEAFGIGVLAIVPDFTAPPGPHEVERAIASLAEAARWAQAFGVTLALEPRGRLPFCSSIPTALSLIEAAGEPNVGLCLDLFHYYTGPSKLEDLALLRPERLALVQVCDLAGVARELATDSARIFPGEGDFQLRPILAHLEAIGYAGPVSLEVLNPDLWRAGASQVVSLGLASLQRLLPASRGRQPSE
jgi:sugar phosphate isomerase/epimerase